MEDIEKLIEALRKAYNFQDWPIIASHATIVDRKTVHAAADALERLNKFEGIQMEKLLAENERLRSTCYPRDGVEAIIRERDAYKEELAAERAKYAELQRYNVDCTKACDRQMVEILELREQNAQLSESQRREQAAVEDAKQGSVCRTCHYLNNGCEPLNLDAGCHKWEWRGPGAGEGAAK